MPTLLVGKIITFDNPVGLRLIISLIPVIVIFKYIKVFFLMCFHENMFWNVINSPGTYIFLSELSQTRSLMIGQ